MGDTFGEGEDDEKPAHEVTHPPFQLGRYERIFEEFDLFVDRTGYAYPPSKIDPV